MKTEIPDTTKGTHLVGVKGNTFAIYYVDGKQKRKSLGAVSGKKAIKERDAFFAKLIAGGAVVRRKKTDADKVAENPDRYLHYEMPYKFVYKGEVIARGKTKKEVREARDKFFQNS